MFLACSKLLNLLYRPILGRTTPTPRPSGGKSARLKYRLLQGPYGYKNLVDQRLTELGPMDTLRKKPQPAMDGPK
jgi:hypothetical protein